MKECTFLYENIYNYKERADDLYTISRMNPIVTILRREKWEWNPIIKYGSKGFKFEASPSGLEKPDRTFRVVRKLGPMLNCRPGSEWL